jgi:hypothetical protein
MQRKAVAGEDSPAAFREELPSRSTGAEPPGKTEAGLPPVEGAMPEQPAVEHPAVRAGLRARRQLRLFCERGCLPAFCTRARAARPERSTDAATSPRRQLDLIDQMLGAAQK